MYPEKTGKVGVLEEDLVIRHAYLQKTGVYISTAHSIKSNDQ